MSFFGCFGLFKLFHCASEFERKQYERKGYGLNIGYRLCGINTNGLIGYYMRHYIDERYQQNEFAHNGYYYRARSIAY